MTAKRILVLGGGFAGLWGALGAARKLDELGCGPEAVEVVLVNRDAYHNIRVRNYEADLTQVRVPLDDVLQPAGVRRLEGEVAGIDLAHQWVTVTTGGGPEALSYDRLVFALGSQLLRPAIPGLAEWAFDVDTYAGAARLAGHLRSLSVKPDTPGRFTVVVVGAGLTGIEAAAEMPGRLRAVLTGAQMDRPVRVILADRGPRLGSDLGDSARPVIAEALAALNIETRVGIEITAIDSTGLTLSSGEVIDAATVVWCGGMEAHPLTRVVPVEHDRFGRIPVDEYLRPPGVPKVFAAGDVAAAPMDHGHVSVMSCQHARPMGRFAGHNAACDLLGLPLLPLRIEWYATVLDLGAWGAVYTEGWDRHVISQGAAAKQTKLTINRQRIYPPLSGDRGEILAAAAPVVQPPPATYV
jgi:NADH dehydrogenase